MNRKLRKTVVIPLLVLIGLFVSFKCFAAYAEVNDYIGVTVIDSETGLQVDGVRPIVTGPSDKYRYSLEPNGIRFVFCFYVPGEYEIFFEVPNYDSPYSIRVTVTPDQDKNRETVIVGYIRMIRQPN